MSAFSLKLNLIVLNLCQTNVQATVDHEARFTSFEIGFPGCMTDVTIFKQSDIWVNRARYFSDHEYILVDKGEPFDTLYLSCCTYPSLPRLSIKPLHHETIR